VRVLAGLPTPAERLDTHKLFLAVAPGACSKRLAKGEPRGPGLAQTDARQVGIQVDDADASPPARSRGNGQKRFRGRRRELAESFRAAGGNRRSFPALAGLLQATGELDVGPGERRVAPNRDRLGVPTGEATQPCRICRALGQRPGRAAIAADSFVLRKPRQYGAAGTQGGQVAGPRFDYFAQPRIVRRDVTTSTRHGSSAVNHSTTFDDGRDMIDSK